MKKVENNFDDISLEMTGNQMDFISSDGTNRSL